MAVVYRRYYEDIGTFNDTRYLVHMLDKCSDRQVDSDTDTRYLLLYLCDTVSWPFVTLALPQGHRGLLELLTFPLMEFIRFIYFLYLSLVQERDRTLQFMHSLLKHKKNVKLLLDAGGIKILIDLVTLAHLHTSRATTPFQVWR